MKLVVYSLLLSIAALHGSCLQTEIFYKIRQLVDKHRQSLQARHDFLEQQTIEQPLDHFEPSQKTFEQRYWVNANYWRKEDGPVFLYIGGESRMSAAYIDGGMYELLHSQFACHRTLCCSCSSVPPGGVPEPYRCSQPLLLVARRDFSSRLVVLMDVLSVFNIYNLRAVLRPF